MSTNPSCADDYTKYLPGQWPFNFKPDNAKQYRAKRRILVYDPESGDGCVESLGTRNEIRGQPLRLDAVAVIHRLPRGAEMGYLPLPAVIIDSIPIRECVIAN